MNAAEYGVCVRVCVCFSPRRARGWYETRKVKIRFARGSGKMLSSRPRIVIPTSNLSLNDFTPSWGRCRRASERATSENSSFERLRRVSRSDETIDTHQARLSITIIAGNRLARTERERETLALSPTVRDYTVQTTGGSENGN